MGSNKNTVILLGVLVLLLAVAYPFLTKNSEPVDLASVPVGSDMSGVLQQIDSVKFDMAILQNKVLQSLKNLTLPPLDLPVGKSNPFTSAK
jgi:hypothetical protein